MKYDIISQEKWSERNVIIDQSYLRDNDWFFIFGSIRININTNTISIYKGNINLIKIKYQAF